jgi:hypothetical protein
MSDTLKDLKNLLEGAKILEVRNSGRKESICEFLCEKDKQKYSFTLFATNLGAWVENRQDAHGNY